MEVKSCDGPAVHEWTGPTGVKFRDVRTPEGTYYHDTTPPEVVTALESARRTGAKVRLFFGDKETGRDWLEEWDVYGKVGRSMGPMKIPLLIKTCRSMGGGAISDDCIVRLIVNGREVYRHPKYHVGFTIRETQTEPGYTHAVDVGGKNHANFKSLTKAQRWVEFMRGERMSK